MITIERLEQLSASIHIPGSKYVANRAIIAALLANGTSRLAHLPHNQDITAALQVSEHFGASVHSSDEETTIQGTGGKLSPVRTNISVGESGTLLRFASALAALSPEQSMISGNGRINERPIQELIDALLPLGITGRTTAVGTPPLVISGGPLKGGRTVVAGERSSQFLSALLLVSPYAEQNVEIAVEGELVSKPYIDMTIAVMADFGVKIERDAYQCFWIKAGQRYAARTYAISGDVCSASYFLAAAAVLPGKILIENASGLDLQGEAHFPELLQRMGCTVKRDNATLFVEGPERLNGLTVDMGDMPDVVQTLAAIAPFANTPTTISGIAHLKHKESDRIADTASELRRLGCGVEAGDDYLKILPLGEAKLTTTVACQSHGDHRMAMSLALLGLKRGGVMLEGEHCVSKSFPNYFEYWRSLGARIHHV